MPFEDGKPDLAISSGGHFEDEEPTSSLWRRLVADPAISLIGKGSIGVPETAVGLADIVTGGYAGKAAEAVGFRPKEAKEYLDTLLSPEQQEANRRVQETKGFFPTIGAAIQNPSTIAHSVLESLPSVGAGGVLARGAMAAAPKLAPLVAGAMGEGAVSAGSTAEQIRQQTPTGTLSLPQAALAAGSGAATAGFGVAGGKLAHRLGIADIDTLIASGKLPEGAKKGLARRIGEGIFIEGPIEELPQSVQEQIAQNLALGKPAMEGVPEAGAMGMLAGSVMGGGVAAMPTKAPTQEILDRNPDSRKAAEELLQKAAEDVIRGTDTLNQETTELGVLRKLAGTPEQRGILTDEDRQVLVKMGYARVNESGGLITLPFGRRRLTALEAAEATGQNLPEITTESGSNLTNEPETPNDQPQLNPVPSEQATPETAAQAPAEAEAVIPESGTIAPKTVAGEPVESKTDEQLQALAAAPETSANTRHAAVAALQSRNPEERPAPPEVESPILEPSGPSVPGVATGQESGLPEVSRRISEATGAKVTLEEGAKGQIKLSGIQVPDSEQGRGTGTAALSEVKKYADETGRNVVLTAVPRSPDLQDKLNRFYEKNGFVQFSADPLSGSPMFGYKAKSAQPAVITPVAPEIAPSQEGAVVDLAQFRALRESARRADKDIREEIRLTLADIEAASNAGRMTSQAASYVKEAVALANQGADGDAIIEPLDRAHALLYPTAVNDEQKPGKTVAELLVETSHPAVIPPAPAAQPSPAFALTPVPAGRKIIRGQWRGEFHVGDQYIGDLHEVAPGEWRILSVDNGRVLAESGPLAKGDFKKTGSYAVSASQKVARFAPATAVAATASPAVPNQPETAPPVEAVKEPAGPVKTPAPDHFAGAGKMVERFTGQYKKGMGKTVVQQQQKRLAKERPELDWKIELAPEFGDQRFQVVGYGVEKATNVAEKAATNKDSLPVAPEETSDITYPDRQAATKAAQKLTKAGQKHVVRPVKGGFAVEPKETREPTEKQVAARAAAADRWRKANQARRRPDPITQSLNEWLAKRGGISLVERNDIISEGNKSFAGMWLFKREGEGIDNLARRAYEDGYLTDEEYNSADGGVSALKAKVAEEFNGQRPHYSSQRDQQAAQPTEEDVLFEQAASLGIDTEGMSIDQVREAVKRPADAQEAVVEAGESPDDIPTMTVSDALVGMTTEELAYLDKQSESMTDAQWDAFVIQYAKDKANVTQSKETQAAGSREKDRGAEGARAEEGSAVQSSEPQENLGPPASAGENKSAEIKQKTESEFHAYLADLKAKEQARIAAIGEVGDYAIMRNDKGDRWQAVLPDTSGGNFWRTQSFDANGFSGHMVYNSKDEAIRNAAQDGYYARDDGALDRLQDTPGFRRGIAAAVIIRKANGKEITWEQAHAQLAAFGDAVKPDPKPALELAAQTPEELRAEAERIKAAEEAQQREERNAEAKTKRERIRKEVAEREARVIAEREAAKKAEVDAAVADFALGQEPPAPVVKKVTPSEAAGQQDVFARPANELSPADLLRAAAAKMDSEAAAKGVASEVAKPARTDQIGSAATVPMLDQFVADMTPQEAGSARAALSKTMTFRQNGKETRGTIQAAIENSIASGDRVVLTASGPALVGKDMKGWNKRTIGEYGMQYANWLSSQEPAPNRSETTPTPGRGNRFEASDDNANEAERELRALSYDNQKNADDVTLGTGKYVPLETVLKYIREVEAVVGSLQGRPAQLGFRLDIMPRDWNRVLEAAAKAKPADLVGKLVKLQIPGPTGPMNVAGTVKRSLPGGMIEVKTQQHGYHTVAESSVTLAHPPAPEGGQVEQPGPEYNSPVNPDQPTEVRVDPDDLSRAVLARMDVRLKALGYDSRGFDDVRTMLKTRIAPDGVITQPDWIAAYEAAVAGAEKTRERVDAKRTARNQATHVDFARMRELGLTEDWREAGYITPRGSLIDLSGKREGGERGMRSYDHREAGGTIGMQEYMALGNIRIDANTGSIDISREPTPVQYKRIAELAENRGGEITVDLEQGLGELRGDYYLKPERSFSREYPVDTKPARILADIRRFFAGEEPRPLLGANQTGLEYSLDQPEQIYDHIETREGTTQAQKDAGIRALAGWVGMDTELGRGNNRVGMPEGTLPRATLLASALWDGFSRHGGAELIGQQVGSAQELALASQILRNDDFEVMRVWLTKGGKIVGHTATTARLAGSTQFTVEGQTPFERIAEIKAMMEEKGADGYWLLHNHPNGLSKPSSPDVYMTKWVAANLPGFRGHVIIDHNEYTLINARGVSKLFSIKSPQSLAPELPHKLLGRQITGPVALTEIGKELGLKKGWVTVVTLSSIGKIQSLAEIPESELTEGAAAKLHRFLNKTGSGGLFLIAENPERFDSLIEHGVVTDTIDPTGQRIGRFHVTKGKQGVGMLNARQRVLRAEQMVWHGSPHEFEQFSLQKIGTGEGAAAYGWGLYFAGNREVAEYYRKALSGRNSFNGMSATKGDEGLRGHDILRAYYKPGAVRQTSGGLFDQIISYDEENGTVTVKRFTDAALKKPDMGNTRPVTYGTQFGWTQSDQQRVTQALEKEGWAFTRGRLYQVDLAPQEDEYLDWDRPLSEQSEKVREALGDLPEKIAPKGMERDFKMGFIGGGGFYARLGETLADQNIKDDGWNSFVQTMNDRVTNQEAASRYLASIGIPGIRYLDGSSRGKTTFDVINRAGTVMAGGFKTRREAENYIGRQADRASLSIDQIGGNHNYVLFDDKLAKIVGVEQAAPAYNRASWDAPEPSRLDTLIYTLQDKQIDTRRVLQAIRAQSKQIADAQDVYLQEELFHGRAAKGTQAFVNGELKPLITEMAARKVTMAEFEEYLHARHAEEANIVIAGRNPDMPDGGSGIDTADAKAYLSSLDPAKKRAYEALAKQVDAINDATRQILVDYEIESQDTIDTWKAAYKHYVPLHREDMGGGPGIGQGFSVRGPASKMRTGSKRTVVDILANIAMQREKNIVRGEKNRVATALYGLAKANPNPEFWAPAKPGVTTSISAETGDPVEVIDMSYQTWDNVVMSRALDKDGKIVQHGVEFNKHDERAMRMARSLKNLDMDQLGEVLGTAAKATRYFASVNTQYNPVFGVVNLTRDTQQALFNLTTTPIAGKQAEVLKHTVSALKGIYLDLRAERKGAPQTSAWAQLFEEFTKEGGQTGYRDMFRTSKDRAGAIEREFKRVTEGKAKQFGRAVFDWLSDYNTAMENAVRLAAYKVGKESGMTNQRAASMAKNLTVNFNRKGQITTQAGALYAFLNASVQGTTRLVETLRGPMGKKIVTGGVTLGVVQALALAAAGFDDDEPPEFIRERSTIIPIGDKKYITIPMPLGLHFIPNIGRISTEFVLSGFKHPGRRVASLVNVFVDAFNPVGSAGLSLQTVAPTVVDPLAALAENRDWTGKPIARQDMSQLSPTPGHARAKDTASAFSKAVSQGLNYASGGTTYKPGLFSPTPDQIDYLIGQATGGIGREVMKLEQSAASVITGEDLPTYKIPLVGRFYGNSEQQSSQGNAFYNNLKEINAHEAEIKGRRKAGEPVGDYIKDNPEARLIKLANATERQVSKLRRRKRELMAKDASPEIIKEVDTQITNRMRRFNEQVKQAQAR